MRRRLPLGDSELSWLSPLSPRRMARNAGSHVGNPDQHAVALPRSAHVNLPLFSILAELVPVFDQIHQYLCFVKEALPGKRTPPPLRRESKGGLCETKLTEHYGSQRRISISFETVCAGISSKGLRQ